MKQAIAMIIVVFLAGCNTMSGLGKDIETLGNKLNRKAEEVKK